MGDRLVSMALIIIPEEGRGAAQEQTEGAQVERAFTKGHWVASALVECGSSEALFSTEFTMRLLGQ